MKDSTIKNVAIIGAGYIGIELAETAKRCNKNVTIIDMLDQPVKNYYDIEFTKDLTNAMKQLWY